jgi:hypothetical protein
MRLAFIVIGLILLLAGGLWWRHQHPAHPAPVNAPSYETDMTEALLRKVLTELPPPVPPVCFLAFGDGRTSPSREFIARFTGSQPVVRSCGAAASPPIGRYFDAYTGREGLIVHIVSFKEIISGTSDYLVRFSNLPDGHDRFTYRIAHTGGEWLVKPRQPA